MNELIAAVRARLVERGADIVRYSRRRALIAGLTCFGTGAVLVGLVVWSSQYLPLWVVTVSIGIGGLGAAYGLERGTRREGNSAPSGANRNERAERQAEMSEERQRDDTAAAFTATPPLVAGSLRSLHQNERRDDALVGRSLFTIGALVGVGLATMVEEIRVRNRGSG